MSYIDIDGVTTVLKKNTSIEYFRHIVSDSSNVARSKNFIEKCTYFKSRGHYKNQSKSIGKIYLINDDYEISTDINLNRKINILKFILEICYPDNWSDKLINIKISNKGPLK